MRALVKARAEPGLWFEEVPVPEIGPEDALVKVLRTGICGTDVHILRWNEWARANVSTPLVVGHEFVGVVDKIGDRVSEIAPGDLVSGEGHLVCGRCRNCMAGRRVQCAHTTSVGVTRSGAFAEFISLPAHNLWRHHAGIDLDVAAIFDPFGNAVHVATAFPLLGEDLLITGCGPIGLMAAIVARHAGARHIVASDPSPFRRGLAQRVGVTRVVDPLEERLADAASALGMTEGFDVAFEMSGSPAALRELLATLTHGAKVALLGLPDDEFAIDWSQLIMNMTTLRGIYGRQIFETWYEMSVLVEAGVDVSPVITHRFAARDFAEALEVVAGGECGKVLLDWSEV